VLLQAWPFAEKPGKRTDYKPDLSDSFQAVEFSGRASAVFQFLLQKAGAELDVHVELAVGLSERLLGVEAVLDGVDEHELQVGQVVGCVVVTQE